MNKEYFHDINQKKNSRIGWIVSLSIHATLLLLFIFMIAWRAPDPPLPVYGVEINLGLENLGSGETPSSPKQVPLEEPEEQVEPEVSETINEGNTSENLITQEESSPQTIEKPENTSLSENLKSNETPKETTEPEKPLEKKVFKPLATYPSVPSNDNKSSGEGNDKDKTGDKGKPDGDPRSRYYTGTPGDGGDGDGASLSLSGWSWETKPNPKDQSSESGKIVFEIKVDSRGDIISVKTIEKSVSSEVLQIYKNEVEKLKFRKTLANAEVPQVSTGTITFIIRSR